MSDPKPKDLWDKIDIGGKLLSALLVPFALVLVGQTFNQQAATRDETRRQAERDAEDGRLRIDRMNTLIESLSSENPQRRRLAVEWAKYLDTQKQLPPQATAVVFQVALSDPNEDIAQFAAAVTADVATGNVEIRTLAASRLGVRTSSTLDPLRRVLAVPVQQAEGIVSVPPCSVGGSIPFASANCDRGTATAVDVCTKPIPKTAVIRATRLFTKWAGDSRSWDQAETRVGSEGDWNVFERTFARDTAGDQQQICATFRHWSSHQERVARIEVTFAAGTP